MRVSILKNNVVWLIVSALVLAVVAASSASAIKKIPTPPPSPGSFGLEATKKKPAPTSGARISSPGNGASYTKSPITVRGICPSGLLVEIYNNGVMVGSTMCKAGGFSLEVSLFAGKNELTAAVYDELGQAGPKSNLVSVTYRNTQFENFGELITLTSSFGRRSAAVNQTLSWPLQLSGGTGPYALSIDWGDGSQAELKSQSVAGTFTLQHSYERAGIYLVNVRVTDKNGVTAFLQVVALANGDRQAGAALEAPDDGICREKEHERVVWLPAVIALLMLIPAYWLGRRSQLVTLRKTMLAQRQKYDN